MVKTMNPFDAEQLQLTLSFTNQGLYELNLQTQVVVVSPTYATMLGYDPHTFCETVESWRARLHPDDCERASSVFAAYVAGLIAEYSQEFRLRTAEGGWKWILSIGQIVDRDGKGRPLRMLGSHTDVTLLREHDQGLLQLNRELERRVADRTAALEWSQAALRKSEAHLRAAQRIALLGSWEFEAATEAIIWSDEIYRIFGRPITQGPPSFRELLAYYLPEDQQRHSTVVEQSLATGQAYMLELRLMRADGELRHIQVRGEPILDAQGKVQRLVGTVLDITERKRAEDEQQRLAARLALAIRSAAIGIWEWDVLSNVITWDERMYALYGVACVTPVSYEIWGNSIHPDDRILAHQAIQQAINGEKEFDTEFRVVHPDGTQRDIKAYGAVLRNAAGEPLRMIGVNFDVTERKRAEAERKAKSHQLAALNRELEAFAYSVSHDLRAPLRAIHGFSQALNEDYGQMLDAQAQDYLARIMAGAERMGMLIDDLLRLARVSRGEMDYRWVDLSQQVAQISADLQRQGPTRQVTWTITPEVYAWADANLLYVALQNLLANAWKFTSHHEQACITFGTTTQNGQAAYFIRDDGAGFDPAHQNKLFGVFQRLHDHHEFPGTGIGLATVQRIIARHGGQIWAEGALEQGATFYFTLPGRVSP
ncbi:MAG: PAS domain S-box protein [Candidatus Viridilinea halotolerans]|uniref:histidine kinase n=1 Tax=Candidatus Viridilinea halotolerans TaxID=2491704 RepID=A0A426TXA3_9CHLR|nr:MAG: PAS domain S-box protein [Candidatus Viridilinea halotolerans]